MKHAGKAVLVPMVANIIRVADKDGDGKMEFSEFLAVLAPSVKVSLTSHPLKLGQSHISCPSRVHGTVNHGGKGEMVGVWH